MALPNVVIVFIVMVALMTIICIVMTIGYMVKLWSDAQYAVNPLNLSQSEREEIADASPPVAVAVNIDHYHHNHQNENQHGILDPNTDELRNSLYR